MDWYCGMLEDIGGFENGINEKNFHSHSAENFYYHVATLENIIV